MVGSLSFIYGRNLQNKLQSENVGCRLIGAPKNASTSTNVARIGDRTRA